MADRSGFQLESLLHRTCRMIGRVQDREDAELRDELVRSAAAMTAVLPDTPGRIVPATSDIATMLEAALSALSVAARSADPADVAARRSLEQLGFELAASLWMLGRRPEMICIGCGASYQPIGLLRCPACG